MAIFIPGDAGRYTILPKGLALKFTVPQNDEPRLWKIQAETDRQTIRLAPTFVPQGFCGTTTFLSRGTGARSN
jgi:hypothetical protein